MDVLCFNHLCDWQQKKKKSNLPNLSNIEAENSEYCTYRIIKVFFLHLFTLFCALHLSLSSPLQFRPWTPSWHQSCALLCQQRCGVLVTPSQTEWNHPQVHHLLLQPRVRPTGELSEGCREFEEKGGGPSKHDDEGDMILF